MHYLGNGDRPLWVESRRSRIKTISAFLLTSAVREALIILELDYSTIEIFIQISRLKAPDKRSLIKLVN